MARVINLIDRHDLIYAHPCLPLTRSRSAADESVETGTAGDLSGKAAALELELPPKAAGSRAESSSSASADTAAETAAKQVDDTRA